MTEFVSLMIIRYAIIFRPCSQIDEEIEDIDEAGVTGDDSEMTCINSLEIKQVRLNIKF